MAGRRFQEVVVDDEAEVDKGISVVQKLATVEVEKQLVLGAAIMEVVEYVGLQFGMLVTSYVYWPDLLPEEPLPSLSSIL